VRLELVDVVAHPRDQLGDAFVEAPRAPAHLPDGRADIPTLPERHLPALARTPVP
jgi:hypothetical protein